MADTTFTFAVRAEPAGQTTHRTLSAPFGDGYTQKAANGINTKEDSWNLSARGQWDPSGVACAPGQNVKEIADFIDDHGGWKSFNWTNPLGETSTYRCDGYSSTKEAPNVVLLNFTFYRSYMP